MILNAVEAGQGPPVVLLHGLFGTARNLGAVQRALAPRFRVIALDLRNHGASPHAAEMNYPAMVADVLETLARRDALPAALIGHSMGGKTAMLAALTRPEAVTRLLVADIAPVPYVHDNDRIAAAMLGLELTRGMTRAVADAALAGIVPDASMRAFLLQNLVVGEHPHWRIGLAEIAGAVRALEGWDVPPGRVVRWPGAVCRGCGVRLRPPRTPAGDPGDVLRRALRHVEERRALAACRQSGWLHRDRGGVPGGGCLTEQPASRFVPT